MRSLDLSETHLRDLKVDTFAELSLLEKLNLAHNEMENISFGLFPHQQNLKFLNMSSNKLRFIDQHMFLSMENLTTWDLSGNKLTKLENFDRYRETFPKLKTIAIDDNDWNCKYLAKLVTSFKRQAIEIASPRKPVKSTSSVTKIGCEETAEREVILMQSFDEVSAAIVNLTDRLNQLELQAQSTVNIGHQEIVPAEKNSRQPDSKSDFKNAPQAEQTTQQGPNSNVFATIVASFMLTLLFGCLLALGLFIYFNRNLIKAKLQRSAGNDRSQSMSTIRTETASVLA